MTGKDCSGDVKISLISNQLEKMDAKINTDGEIEIPLTSDLGKQIAARKEQLDQRRERGGPNIEGQHNELDNYVPVYKMDNTGPWPKATIIGYRQMTEEEKSGKINY